MNYAKDICEKACYEVYKGMDYIEAKTRFSLDESYFTVHKDLESGKETKAYVARMGEHRSYVVISVRRF